MATKKTAEPTPAPAPPKTAEPTPAPGERVTFKDDDGAEQTAIVGPTGRVALRCLFPHDGLNVGEVFGDLPARAFRLVAQGKAEPVNALAFDRGILSGARASGGEAASVDDTQGPAA